nr:PREDICTED: P2Y purinoceptor 4-like isoform X2 [Lepisosteus oculatus]XP_015222598.1 PREDICTED: P2Y purinoceptor 4-like isoform X2 [Lepisosteus oculatus]
MREPEEETEVIFPMDPALSNSTQCQPHRLHNALPCLLGIVYISGFFLNGLGLWVFGCHVKKWNASMVLQFNLALTDVLITPVAPFIVLYSLTDHWPYGQFLCQLKVGLLSAHMYGSICFLTLISIHRYLTVVQGASKSRCADKSFVKKLCLVVWVVLLLQGLPFFVILETSEVHNSTKCLSIHQSGMAVLYFSYNVVVLIVGLIVPFTVCLVCYSWLSTYISRLNARSLKSRAMKAKSVQVIAVCLLIFTGCYVPVHVARTIGVTVKLFYPAHCELLHRTEVSYYVTFTISSMNCCLDPLLYCFASKRFREAFQSYITSVRCLFPGSRCLKPLRKAEPTGSTNIGKSAEII